jgi:hypothetical protein
MEFYSTLNSRSVASFSSAANCSLFSLVRAGVSYLQTDLTETVSLYWWDSSRQSTKASEQTHSEESGLNILPLSAYLNRTLAYRGRVFDRLKTGIGIHWFSNGLLNNTDQHLGHEQLNSA